ncbi:MAG: hypothetical protein ACRDI2_08960, partial [Chloroflexota bacterium]
TDELATTLDWLTVNRGVGVAEAARTAVDTIAEAAAQRPLAYPWVGTASPGLVHADRSYRRALAWKRRLHIYHRYDEAEDRVVVHVRGARQRPPSLRRLTDTG